MPPCRLRKILTKNRESVECASDHHGEYPASSCSRSLNHYILWSPTLVPEGPKKLSGLLFLAILFPLNVFATGGAIISNGTIQMVKLMACGYRNRQHYRAAIYFHCGGLDLNPRPEAL